MGHKIWMIKEYKGDTQADSVEIETERYQEYVKKGFKYNSYARPFHSSWDYLMKVVDKINKIGKYDVIIYPSSCQIITLGEGQITYRAIVHNEKLIDVAYKAIVDLLKIID